MKYSVLEAPCVRLLQQEPESPDEEKDAHPATVSAQLLCSALLCAPALPLLLLLLLLYVTRRLTADY